MIATMWQLDGYRDARNGIIRACQSLRQSVSDICYALCVRKTDREQIGAMEIEES